MSHYAVLVLHKKDQNIKDLLKPYDENLKVAPYLKYPVNEAIKMIKEDYVPYVDSIKIILMKNFLNGLQNNIQVI